MSKIGLEFLPNEGGEAEGLSDAGIETFRDKPFAAVARETGQNSRDARDDVTRPVRIAFDTVTLKSSELPSIDEYRKVANLCLKKASRPGNDKERGFFEHAMRTLNEPTIKVLRISDHNTKGVRGPCEEGRPFHTLAKTDGVSTKEDINSGGSFGIGKNAVFALSDIQTAFFSTRYTDEAGKQHAFCMGKTLFVSHRGVDGKEKRRKGYWGKIDGYMPLDKLDEIPAWLRRDSQGTSIFSICMRSAAANWRYEMVAAILMNFFCAIERGEMEFEIDDGFVKINRNTLQNHFQSANVISAVGQLNAQVAFEAAKTLHACLIDQSATEQTFSIDGLGNIRMRILLREGLGYTIGIVRNGMYITDNFGHFNEPFKRFPLHRDFAVVIEPAGQKEGEWFKRLENPRHDDLSAERITDPELRRQGQKAFAQLAKQIRERIRKLAKAEPTGALELDELSDFFATDQATREDDAGPETDPKALKPTPIKRSPPRTKPASGRASEDDDQPIGPVQGPEPQGGPVNPDPHPQPPGDVLREQPRSEPVQLERPRNIIPDAAAPHIRKLFFTSPTTGPIILQLHATGLSSRDRLVARRATGATLRNGEIEVSCVAGQRVTMEVEFDSPYTGPIEVDAYANTNSWVAP